MRGRELKVSEFAFFESTMTLLVASGDGDFVQELLHELGAVGGDWKLLWAARPSG